MACINWKWHSSWEIHITLTPRVRVILTSQGLVSFSINIGNSVSFAILCKTWWPAGPVSWSLHFQLNLYCHSFNRAFNEFLCFLMHYNWTTIRKGNQIRDIRNKISNFMIVDCTATINMAPVKLYRHMNTSLVKTPALISTKFGVWRSFGLITRMVLHLLQFPSSVSVAVLQQQSTEPNYASLCKLLQRFSQFKRWLWCNYLTNSLPLLLPHKSATSP